MSNPITFCISNAVTDFESFQNDLRLRFDLARHSRPDSFEGSGITTFGGKKNSVNLYLSWIVSEYSGGNCWGGEATYKSFDTVEPSWKVLYDILEVYVPNVPFLQYRKLMEKTTTEAYYVSGYYGNGSTYRVRLLDLHELFEFIKANQQSST